MFRLCQPDSEQKLWRSLNAACLAASTGFVLQTYLCMCVSVCESVWSATYVHQPLCPWPSADVVWTMSWVNKRKWCINSLLRLHEWSSRVCVRVCVFVTEWSCLIFMNCTSGSYCAELYRWCLLNFQIGIHTRLSNMCYRIDPWGQFSFLVVFFNWLVIHRTCVTYFLWFASTLWSVETPCAFTLN